MHVFLITRWGHEFTITPTLLLYNLTSQDNSSKTNEFVTSLIILPKRKVAAIADMFLCLNITRSKSSWCFDSNKYLFQTRCLLSRVGLKNIWARPFWFFQKISWLNWFLVCRSLLKICCTFIVCGDSDSTRN